MTLYIMRKKSKKKKDKKKEAKQEEIKDGNKLIIQDKEEYLDPKADNKDRSSSGNSKSDDKTSSKTSSEKNDNEEVDPCEVSMFMDQIKDSKDSIFRRFWDIITEKVSHYFNLGLYFLCFGYYYLAFYFHSCCFLGYRLLV